MVEGPRVETWELILLVLEQLVYTNPTDPEKVDECLPDGQPTPYNTTRIESLSEPKIL